MFRLCCVAFLLDCSRHPGGIASAGAHEWCWKFEGEVALESRLQFSYGFIGVISFGRFYNKNIFHSIPESKDRPGGVSK